MFDVDLQVVCCPSRNPVPKAMMYLQRTGAQNERILLVLLDTYTWNLLASLEMFPRRLGCLCKGWGCSSSRIVSKFLRPKLKDIVQVLGLCAHASGQLLLRREEILYLSAFVKTLSSTLQQQLLLYMHRKIFELLGETPFLQKVDNTCGVYESRAWSC